MTNIVVNGKPQATPNSSISYEEVLDLGFPGAELWLRTPSMTWRAKDGRGGTLAPGQRVNVSEGMVFNAVHTGNA
jgi:hypothetical protein